jgi:hypothetical protein
VPRLGAGRGADQFLHAADCSGSGLLERSSTSEKFVVSSRPSPGV